MATRKRKVPETSRIDRVRSVAYARKQKSGDDAVTIEPPVASPVDAPSDGRAVAATADADTKPVAKLALDDEAAPSPPPHSIVDDRPLRSRTATVAMAPQSPLGAPPALDVPPPVAANPSISIHGVEDPTHMPGPRELPAGSPDDPAAPPGLVPPGDSRSLRRRDERYEFALIYRLGTFIITRFGMVGTRGQWRVVEYPTSTSASHAYAKECSRFVSDGFSDYRA
jgi:hypothetical protein